MGAAPAFGARRYCAALGGCAPNVKAGERWWPGSQSRAGGRESAAAAGALQNLAEKLSSGFGLESGETGLGVGAQGIECQFVFEDTAGVVEFVEVAEGDTEADADGGIVREQALGGFEFGHSAGGVASEDQEPGKTEVERPIVRREPDSAAVGLSGGIEVFAPKIAEALGDRAFSGFLPFGVIELARERRVGSGFDHLGSDERLIDAGVGQPDSALIAGQDICAGRRTEDRDQRLCAGW